VRKLTHPVVGPQPSGNWGSPHPQTPDGDGAPFEAQVACGGQRVPHEPQFAGSTSVFRHTTAGDVARQSVACGVPAQTQLPAVHVASVPATNDPWQTTPQLPQYPPAPSVRFTHVPGFEKHWSGRAAGQEQVPALQTPSTGQRAPHAPQFVAFVWRSTQAPQQVVPGPQVTPQPPQFEGSALASTHLSPQAICGEWQSGLDVHPWARAPAAARASRARRARFTGSMILRRARACPSNATSGRCGGVTPR
jgi:hypothetical protein